VYPVLRCFAVELRRIDAATDELECTQDNRHDCEHASDGEAKVEREKIARDT
jgi:hypothetical protein